MASRKNLVRDFFKSRYQNKKNRYQNFGGRHRYENAADEEPLTGRIEEPQTRQIEEPANRLIEEQPNHQIEEPATCQIIVSLGGRQSACYPQSLLV